MERWKRVLLEGNALPSRPGYFTHRGQRKVPLRRAEVLQRCVAERQRDGAEELLPGLLGAPESPLTCSPPASSWRQAQSGTRRFGS